MIWGDRSGREPLRARSPLRARRLLALGGGIVCGAGLVLFIVLGTSMWPAALLLVATLVALVDAVVITRRLHSDGDSH